jgi:hypothetical protein
MKEITISPLTVALILFALTVFQKAFSWGWNYLFNKNTLNHTNLIKALNLKVDKKDMVDFKTRIGDEVQGVKNDVKEIQENLTVGDKRFTRINNCLIYLIQKDGTDPYKIPGLME